MLEPGIILWVSDLVRVSLRRDLYVVGSCCVRYKVRVEIMRVRDNVEV